MTPQSPNCPTSARCQILIAEPDGEVRRTLNILLGIAGYEVYVALTGREALNRLKIQKDAGFPMIVLIFNPSLEDMDGLEFLDELRRNGISVPSLAMMDNLDLAVVAELMRRGCRGVIPRNVVNAEALFEKIKELLVEKQEVSNSWSKISKRPDLDPVRRKWEGMK